MWSSRWAVTVRSSAVAALVAGGAVGVRGHGPGGEPAIGGAATAGAAADAGRHAFFFTRATYTDFGGRRFGAWSTDYPKADRQFLIGLKHLTILDAFERENPVRLDDPALRRYPFLYAVEVGYMALTEAEVRGLRGYLLAGGFLVVDDFWGTFEWQSFAAQMARVLPEFPIVDVPRDHPMMNAFYNVDEILQVPNVWLGRRGGRTWERDGYEPALRAIFDERGRLLVVINWNTDLGDAWEWAEDPWYPIRFANFAYQLGVNMIMYGMSH
jgi:hypothetical protein